MTAGSMIHMPEMPWADRSNGRRILLRSLRQDLSNPLRNSRLQRSRATNICRWKTNGQRRASSTTHAKAMTFAALVSFYYSITDDVPDESRANLRPLCPERPAALEARSSRPWPRKAAARLLDLGCGSGGALVVAARDKLRSATWGRHRASLAGDRAEASRRMGVEATLVCADAETSARSADGRSVMSSPATCSKIRGRPAATLKSAGVDLGTRRAPVCLVEQ